MRSKYVLLGLGLILLVAGCASNPISVAPVGPNPAAGPAPSPTGNLQVFSSLVEQSDDQNQANNDEPVWYQHTGYSIYNSQGKLVKHVDNTIGHYDQAPRRVTLPAGKYLIKAQSEDYFWVVAPVVIAPGRTTRVHLDDKWPLPPGTLRNELVWLPNGNPVGWRIAATTPTATN